MTIWLAMWYAFSTMAVTLAIVGSICGFLFLVFVHPKIAITVGGVTIFVILTVMIYTSGG